eukprot:TRINITY_DN6872_c0_g1_i1.p2 TRINITY_DN6872_c0_g1~~TRINITY_DN6872_c0_g1_i1.p2  ORF type:complete len:114 (+),score=50.97 TRINITY_DN6872_c0_g1_i1:58-399(+)
MSTEEKAAYLQKVKAPELLDKLVQAILDENPDNAEAVAPVIRRTLDKLYPPAEADGDFVTVRVEKCVWEQLQNVVPEDAVAHIKQLKGRAPSNAGTPGERGLNTPRNRIHSNK